MEEKVKHTLVAKSKAACMGLETLFNTSKSDHRGLRTIVKHGKWPESILAPALGVRLLRQWEFGEVSGGGGRHPKVPLLLVHLCKIRAGGGRCG